MLSMLDPREKKINDCVEYFCTHKDIKLVECAKMFGIYYGTLRDHLRAIGERENRNHYKSNESFFEKIDTEKKAYWLGFLTADGCIKTKSNCVSIALAVKDVEHLYRFKKDVESEHPIKIEQHVTFDGAVKESCALRISSRKLHHDLENLGFTPNKSCHEQPVDLPENLRPHYIRGMFDGDGWFSCNVISVVKAGKRYPQLDSEFGIGMGSEMLAYIKHCLEVDAGVRPYSVKPYKSIFRYRVTSHKEVLKVYHYLYDNAETYLPRKYDNFQEFCRLVSMSPRERLDYKSGIKLEGRKDRNVSLSEPKAS